MRRDHYEIGLQDLRSDCVCRAMAEITWDAVRQWVHSRHRVAAETDSEMAFTVDVSGSALHVVISRATCRGATWVLVSSPILCATHVPIEDALRLVTRTVVGSLAYVEQRLVVRHAEPIGRLTPEALEDICREIVLSALHVDAMARTITSRSVFQHFAD